MNKPTKINRFPRKTGNSFLVEINPEVFCFGIMHNSETATFFNYFPKTVSEFQWPIEIYPKILFTASIFPDFFKLNETFKLEVPTQFEIENIKVLDFVIRAKDRKFDPNNPWGLDGPFFYEGGDLIRPVDPFYPADSSNGELIIRDLQCQKNRDEIEKYEISGIIPNFDLRERLVACYLSGKNVDPFKAKIFDKCEYLKNEVVLKTSYFVQHKKPLLNVVMDGNGKWVQC